jgi:hypothetical protein
VIFLALLPRLVRAVQVPDPQELREAAVQPIADELAD